MIALVTTYLIVAYILVPGVLFRLPASFFLQLRLFELSKAQEAVLGCLVSVFPWLLALLFVWHVPFTRIHPFSLPPSNVIEYKNDYRRVLTLIVAEDPARLLEPVNNQQSPYSRALENAGHRQLRFLCWYYCFITFEGGLFGYLARKYGDWSDVPAYEWFARKVMLPRVSEWQLLLTDFTFPKKYKRDVFADILCGDHLYRGKIVDYFLGKSGDLTGVLMKEVERFRRKDYEEMCVKLPKDSVEREQFWRKIPGANFGNYPFDARSTIGKCRSSKELQRS